MGGVRISGTRNPAQRRVLRSPQALYLWTFLHESAGPPFAFRSIVDLMRKFWEETRKKLRALKPGEYEDVLEKLVEYLDQRGTMAAPKTVVSRSTPDVDALVSMNVLVADRGKVLFTHQSYLDYLTAERVLREVLTGSGTVWDGSKGTISHSSAGASYARCWPYCGTMTRRDTRNRSERF